MGWGAYLWETVLLVLEFDALKLCSLVKFLLNSLKVFFLICYFIQSADIYKMKGKMQFLHSVRQHGWILLCLHSFTPGTSCHMSVYHVL